MPTDTAPTPTASPEAPAAADATADGQFHDRNHNHHPDHNAPTASPVDVHDVAENTQPAALWKQGIALIALLVVVGLAWWWFASGGDAAPAAPTAGAGGPLPVGVVTVAPRDVPLASQFLAQTEPSQTVPIRARVSGYLVEQNFEEGQAVEAGQPLFKIDPKPFDVALRQAKAGLLAAQAQQQRAEQQVKRFQGLAELQQAAANELEQAQETQRVAAAQVETQQAMVEQAELDLGYATVNSPISGTIGQRAQDVGSYVGGAGDNALLATVRKVDPMYVRFSVSEQDLLRWQRLEAAGQVNDVPVDQLDVTIVLADGRELPQIGHINYVDVAVDPSTGTAVVRATVPNPEATLLPGQYVTARVSGVSRLNALVIPRPAVTQTPGGASVMVVDAEGKAQARPVTLGEWTSDGWIVEQGLEPGDRVIVDHLMQARPGTPVQPTEAPPTPPTTPPTTQPAAPSAPAA